MLQIWICIDLALLDPDPFWEYGSGSRGKDIDQELTHKPDFPAQPRMLFYLLYVQYVQYL